MKYSLPVLLLLDFDAVDFPALVASVDLPAFAASEGVGVPGGVLADLEAAAKESALAKYVRRMIMMCFSRDVIAEVGARGYNEMRV